MGRMFPWDQLSRKNIASPIVAKDAVVAPEGVCFCVRVCVCVQHSYVICGVQRCGILLCALGESLLSCYQQGNKFK